MWKIKPTDWFRAVAWLAASWGKIKSSSVRRRRRDPSGGRVPFRAGKREGKKRGDDDQTRLRMWKEKPGWRPLNLTLSSSSCGSCRRQQRDDLFRWACVFCACMCTAAGGIYHSLMPVIKQSWLPQWVYRLVRSRNMWFTSDGWFPVDPATAAGRYRNTIQGAQAAITSLLTLSRSSSFSGFSRGRSQM